MSPGPKVLVVDDEHTVRTLMRQILQQAGYAVIEAGSGNEALQLFKEHQATIEVLVTDVIMPGQSGTELVHEILRLRADLAVVFVSGHCADYRSAMQGFAYVP